MRAVPSVLACVLLPGVTVAQGKGQDPGSLPDPGTDLASEVQALREALSQTQKQLATQQAEIQTLKAQSKAGLVTPAETPSHIESDARTYDFASHELGETGSSATLTTGEKQAQQTGTAEK